MLLFITGPSGAGKSTLARAWVASRQREVALIDADHITSWLRLGEQGAVHVAFADRSVSAIARQYQITAQVYAAVASVYAQLGVDVVLAQLCGFDPPPPWSKGWDLLNAFNPVFVVLLPKREICAERLEARGSVAETGSYDFDWLAWTAHPRAVFLDNSEMSVPESVEALDRLL